MGWIALVGPNQHTKFGDPNSKGVGARGQKAEMQKCALRAHFCTLGAVRPMALKSDQGPSGLKVWAPGHPPFGLQRC